MSGRTGNLYASKRRAEQQALLREKLKVSEYLRQLEEISRMLRRHWNKLTSEQTAALRLRVDINFKRLAKVLPDAKELYVTGHITQDHYLIPVSEALERIGELTERLGEDTDIQGSRSH